jgi:prophage maintenance system killer protein
VSSFPTEPELMRVHHRVAELLGLRVGVENPKLLRAIVLGVRMGRSGQGPRADVFHRAAGLLHQTVTLRPFAAANEATGLAAALLYLARRGFEVRFGPGQAGALARGAADGSMDQDRLASLLRVMARAIAPTGRPTSRSAV